MSARSSLLNDKCVADNVQLIHKKLSVDERKELNVKGAHVRHQYLNSETLQTTVAAE